jgi:F-type H+-transporting ATPase subunit gamma
MPSLKSIRKRIGSVKSTQKITRAMKMVAGARLARAQARITALRPYAVKTGDVLKQVVSTMEGDEGPVHPLLANRGEGRVLFVLLSSDRGLCGAFNTNVCRAAERAYREQTGKSEVVEFATIGKKGRDFLTRRGIPVVRHFEGIYERLDAGSPQQVSDWVMGQFLRERYDAIFIIFNEFKNAISQIVRVQPVLPVPAPTGDGEGSAGASNLLFEPRRDVVLERLVPAYVEVSIQRALLDSNAAEHGSRMSAMDAATRNAKQMISKLTLQYNRARQAAITKELMEIIGGAEAIKD